MNTKRKIYVLSGLGADERVLVHLDFGNYLPVYIKWLTPAPDESLVEYAQRLIDTQISDAHPIIVGLSFGGIIALEIADLLDVQKVILLSSAKTRKELPWYYRIGSPRIVSLIPNWLIKSYNPLSAWLFGAKTHQEKLMLSQILKDTDGTFLNWALRKILQWKRSKFYKNVTHIHGTGDRIIPVKNVKNYFAIQEASHLMTLTHSDDVSSAIQKALQD